MDDVQLKEWRDQYESDTAAIEKEIGDAESSGNTAAFKGLESRVERLTVERGRLEAAEKSARSAHWLARMGDGAGGNDAGPVNIESGPEKGAQLNPLTLPTAQLQKMYKAFRDRQPMSIKAEHKAFSTVESLLPAQLDPQVVAHIHEWRILDRLPMISIDAPTYEFIVHNFAGDSGGPAPVAEGAAKPEYTPDATSSTAAVV